MYVLDVGYLALDPDRRTSDTQLVTDLLFNALLVVSLLPQVSTAKSDAVLCLVNFGYRKEQKGFVDHGLFQKVHSDEFMLSFPTLRCRHQPQLECALVVWISEG
jgi:hypothetical protein